MFNKGSKWVVGRNSHLSLWNDKWLDLGQLRSLISGPLNCGEESTCLKDIANFSGWQWQKLSFVLPANILAAIKATPTSYSALYEDRLSWFSSPSGAFKLKEAYRLACMEGEDDPATSFDGEWI